MRKALIAIAVATALFAVGAFAASFTVQSEDIASGANDVDRCARYVDITFNTPTAPATSSADWTVTTATATFYNDVPTPPAAPTPVPDCDGFSASLSLLVNNANVNITGQTVGPASNASGTVAFTIPGGASVGQITRASVVVDGKFLPSNFVEPTPAP